MKRELLPSQRRLLSTLGEQLRYARLRRDLTPDPAGYGLKLNISETDNSLDYDLALSITPYLGIKKDRAVAIIEQIKSVVAEWRKVATRYGIPKSEQDLVEDAFRY